MIRIAKTEKMQRVNRARVLVELQLSDDETDSSCTTLGIHQVVSEDGQHLGYGGATITAEGEMFGQIPLMMELFAKPLEFVIDQINRSLELAWQQMHSPPLQARLVEANPNLDEDEQDADAADDDDTDDDVIGEDGATAK